MKGISTTDKGFFTVGGALDPADPSYVTRQADADLMRTVLSGQYCNVLTARQMGKSSLMVRTVRRLQDEGICTVTIDLTGLGTEISASEWYFGLISRFKRQLNLTVDIAAWWREREQLGPVQRFSDFLRQVLLEEVQEPIVVFIDEIDSTLNLPFTDDFFAAIRAVYNARASDPVYKRITFVLLGVARPSDLIKDRTRTPYNIGTSVDLTDFTAEEAQVLLEGLKGTHPDQAEEILKRVLYWTGGHPYLTQKVCAELVSKDDHWSDEQIDELVQQLFLAEEARKETNLQFVRDQIRGTDERGEMLRTYRRTRAGKRVKDEERSLAKSRLKLAGLVKTTPDGCLSVRNRIYERVFDRQWIKETMPVSPTQRIAIAMGTVAVLALIVVGYLIYRQHTMPDEIRAELYRENFLSATSTEVQINNLAGLLSLRGYEDEALDLVFGLDADQQLAMFEGLSNPGQVGQDVLTVVQEVYKDSRLVNDVESNQLLRAMASVLHQVEGEEVPGAQAMAMEIDYWIAGREHAAADNYAAAVEQYTLALGLNEENVAVLFDRGQAYAALEEYDTALVDLQGVIESDPTQEEAIHQIIGQDPDFFTYVGLHRQKYQAIASWFPTLTPTAIPTATSIPTSTSLPPTPYPTPLIGAAPVSADWFHRPNDGMVMVYVPTGTFLMGSSEMEIDAALVQCEEYLGDGSCQRSWFENESPQHPVTLDEFWIDRTEVTNAQYTLCVAEGKCERSTIVNESAERDFPVVGASWYDAVNYCTWAGARLPTEAEWEYAARGSKASIFPWGNQEYKAIEGKPILWALLNYCDINCKFDWADTQSDGWATTAPVGSFPIGASRCGALDMAGNAWEWVADWYDVYPSAEQKNPIGPETGVYKILRGGGWDDIQTYARTANRFNYPPDEHYISAGFRCVISLGE